MPSLSVVIPSYNHRAFLPAAFESLEAQTYRDFEVVVVDDGSTDNSPDLIREFAATTPLQTKIHLQSNAGAHAAITKGIDIAEGRNIAILNSDDVFHPDRLRRLMAVVPASGPFIAFSEFAFIDAHGERITADIHNRWWYRHLLERHAYSPGIGFTLVQGNLSISTSNFLFSRELYDLLGGFRQYRTAHDLDFLLRAIFHVEPIFVREVLLNYRLHGTNTITANRELERREVSELFLDYLNQATTEKPANPRAPASEVLAVYSDQVLRQQNLWFELDRNAPAFTRLRQAADLARAQNPDTAAMEGEVNRLRHEVGRLMGELAHRALPALPERLPLRAYKRVRTWPVVKPIRMAARVLGLRVPRRWL